MPIDEWKKVRWRACVHAKQQSVSSAMQIGGSISSRRWHKSIQTGLRLQTWMITDCQPTQEKKCPSRRQPSYLPRSFPRRHRVSCPLSHATDVRMTTERWRGRRRGRRNRPINRAICILSEISHLTKLPCTHSHMHLYSFILTALIHMYLALM